MPREITYREALREGLDEELARDNNVIIIGEEVAEYNGAYKVTEGLWKKWGDKRIIDAPISEAGFIGMGIGASMLGIRPVMELMFFSFAYVAFDQMMNNAATCRYMSGGLINVPIVVRGPANGGTNVGATHSHTPENIFANMPGLKVVTPSDAHDAKGLIKSAIRDNDPVYFMESTVLYGIPGLVPSNDEIEGGELLVPIGKAKVKREGTDITLDRSRTCRRDLPRRCGDPCRETQHQCGGSRPPFNPSARRGGDHGFGSQNTPRHLRRRKQTFLRSRCPDLFDDHGAGI